MVSGLRHNTIPPIPELGFPTAPSFSPRLTHHIVTHAGSFYKRARSHPLTWAELVVGTFQVPISLLRVLLTFSLTVLVHYRSLEYLEGWGMVLQIPTGFLDVRRTQDTAGYKKTISDRALYSLWLTFPCHSSIIF